ncbi:uncharacterized protein [Littorina saxatilis]|uniref:uncharacterized protein n=1 Tax=Littorina saxatilis TaxID=31220 RepID=UPI0038B4AC98
MEVVRQLLMVLSLLSLLAMALAGDVKYAVNCKFSNEGCEYDEECCSGKCLQAHPGTNPRCTRSTLHHDCLYSYQCEDRLSCGPLNTCCSKYWGTCMRHEDCCHSQFVCIEADGFYYKRCLMGKVAPTSRGSQRVNGAAGVLGISIMVLLTRMVVRYVITADTYDVFS